MGPRERFEELFARHAGAVRAYAARRGGHQDADDVVADVFLVAWRRLDELPADPLPWLLGVARRVLANRRRSQGRQEAVRSRLGRERPVQEPSPPTPDDAVGHALAALRETDRELLLLTSWEGLTPEAAARVLGISRGTLAVRLHRARRRFARLMADPPPVAAPPPNAMELT